MTRQLAAAIEDQMKALKDASEFDFVGGGATFVPKTSLPGACINLKCVLEAAQKGIKKYPVPGCDDMHGYLGNMSRETVDSVLVMLDNLGVEENPDFRGVSLRPRGHNESKDSLIVRVVEAFTPKDVALPASIQNLKDKINMERIAKIAQAAIDKREKENVPEDKRRPTLSIKRRIAAHDFQETFSPSNKKRRTRIDTALTPLKLCSSSAPNSSSWEMSDFDDSDVNITEIFSKKDKDKAEVRH